MLINVICMISMVTVYILYDIAKEKYFKAKSFRSQKLYKERKRLISTYGGVFVVSPALVILVVNTGMIYEVAYTLYDVSLSLVICGFIALSSYYLYLKLNKNEETAKIELKESGGVDVQS